MYKGLLFLIVICRVTGFNILMHSKAVKHFIKDDPLFGQTVIQSNDGVFVPSPSNGKLFSCTLKDECVDLNMSDEKLNKLRSVASVASRLISEEEHIVMCNQVRIKKKLTEDLNGNCQLMNPIEKVKLNPVKFVNDYNDRSRSFDQAKKRMRRQAEPDSDTKTDEDEDEEDAGTEIAFVLDGSGSIDADDFERAKDFIHDVMYNVWKACFNCDFAIVQYGSKIRTELSLLDNEDGASTLEKVKKIQQIGNYTITASAIHHVLTNTFIPENGSKNNTKKIIIVLSDGAILGDTMKLDYVLNMPQMKDVNRYSIGVGNEILTKPVALKEMTDIADPGQFFNVSNYAALDDILSKLGKSIIGVEGTQKFELQLAEAGFSSHIVQDKSVLFGAVGAYDWSGGIILKSEGTEKFMNDTNNGPKFSYLGYSVTSAHLSDKTLYISGAPRYNLTGGVFIFNGSGNYVLLGDQVGSYFGSVLCALDIDGDQYTDHLLVGAPHFYKNGEEGKVLVYRLNEDRFESVTMELQGDAGQDFARFGAAIGSIGDIDGNKFNDVAVGAPLETDSSGSIYIYNGFKDGLRFSQKISPSDFDMKLVHFGQSVSGASATAPNKLCIAVGSQGRVSVFESIPVVVIKPAITLSKKVIPLTHQMNELSSKLSIHLGVCFNVIKGKLQSETLPLQYQFDLDSDANKKRITVDNSDQLKNSLILTPEAECTSITLQYLGCFDCFSPMKIKLNFFLAPNQTERILDIFTPTEVVDEISFENDCKAKDCKPSITLSDSKISVTKIIIGDTQSLNINFSLMNTEDPSFLTTLTLTYPSILSQKKIEGATCPVKNDNQIQCNIQHPVFKRDTRINLFVSWQLNDIKSELRDFEIIANLTSQNNGSQLLDSKKYPFNVMYSLPIQLTGTASPNRLRIEEGAKEDTQQMEFEFQFAGENKYGATIDVVVNITKDTYKTDLRIKSVNPEKCGWQRNNVEGPHVIRCTMKELQKIIIVADVLIHDVQGKSDKITAVGKYSFDEAVYTAKDTSRTVTVEVMITKLIVTSSKGAIIGGSIGGFLLLFIIIVILIKCGFFRRRHKVDHAQSPN
ncbi:integrin alpha-E isoform X2 [Pimephales promelas]|uniref:integrin alpha-E isoform X2 n=1 Tax=Pimephales promelas TaxID=90988 RepID=UPI001955D5EC|nr:integrin alpha-E isoform X2 [Pimephales promelas]